MSCALSAARGADLAYAYVFPRSFDVTSYSARLVVYEGLGGDVLLEVDDTPGVNGSYIAFSGQRLEVHIEADDIDALPEATDPTEVSLLQYDVFLTSVDTTTKLTGGVFRLYPLGAKICGAGGDVSVTVGGTDYTVELAGPRGANGVTVPVSTFAETLLDDVSAAGARQTLGVDFISVAAADLPAPSPASRVAYITDESCFASANGERWQRHIVRNYLEDFGAKQGDTSGVATQNRNALLAATAAGIRPTLRENGTYAFGQKVALAAETGLIGETNSELLMLGSLFTNTTTQAEGAGGSTGCMLDVSGGTSGSFTPKDGIILEGFRIRYSGVDGRNVMGVRAINNTNLRISGLEICDFPMGYGIHLESQRGIWGLQDCRIWDFYTNTDLGAGSQSTGILIGDSPVNNIDSFGGVIRNIDIDSITLGPVPYATRGEQTDGLNVQQGCRGLQLSDLRINRVGEAIDCFADNLTCYNLQCEEIRGAAIKLIHGAQYCLFSGGRVYKYGLWGIVISGSTTRARDTAWNVVENFDIVGGGDFQGVWSAVATPAALAFVTPSVGAIGYPTDNVVRNCVLSGAGAEYAVLSPDVNSRNRVADCSTVTGSSGDVHLPVAGTIYQDAKPSLVTATQATSQDIAAGATAVVIFDGVAGKDTNSEFASGTGTFTATKPRTLQVSADVRIPAATSGAVFTIAIFKNATNLAEKIEARSVTTDIPLSIQATFDVVIGDAVQVKVTNGDSVTRGTSNSPRNTRLTITEIRTAGT